jgi:hypothetical protein
MNDETTIDAKKLLTAGAAAIAFALVCGSAFAQDAKIGEDPVSVMMKWKPAAREKEMPDFVRKSRPAEDRLGFTPLTGDNADRPKRKSQAEIEAEIKRFDSAAAAARARAARAFGAARPAARPPAKRAAAE